MEEREAGERDNLEDISQMFRTKKGTRRGKRKTGGDKSRRRREKRKRGKQLRKRAVERRNNSTIKIIAWNMCMMTMSEQNNARVVTHIQKRGCEVVLMTEITSLEEEGVIWMGEAAKLSVIIHSKHSAILLRGRNLNEWLEGGQKKWMTKRTTAAKVGEIRLVSVYQPHSGHNAEEIEEYRGEIEEQIERSGPEEVLVVGETTTLMLEEERGTVRGRHGIGRTNEAGEELTNWCEENNMCIVGSFYPLRRRGIHGYIER